VTTRKVGFVGVEKLCEGAAQQHERRATWTLQDLESSNGGAGGGGREFSAVLSMPWERVGTGRMCSSEMVADVVVGGVVVVVVVEWAQAANS